jgi:hypothetical protein
VEGYSKASFAPGHSPGLGGAEQKEFYASPLSKKVQNKENYPDKAEKEIGEIL